MIRVELVNGKVLGLDLKTNNIENVEAFDEVLRLVNNDFNPVFKSLTGMRFFAKSIMTYEETNE
jgi:hypothetical protein